MTYSISLPDEQIDPDEAETGWWVDLEARRVSIRSDSALSTFTLPRGCRRVTVTRLGGGRGQLILGGFTKTSVVVTGPTDTIMKLREAVL